MKPKHQYCCDVNPAHHTFVATSIRKCSIIKRMRPLWDLQVAANEHRIREGQVLDVEGWKAKQPPPQYRMKQGRALRRARNLWRKEIIK